MNSLLISQLEKKFFFYFFLFKIKKKIEIRQIKETKMDFQIIKNLKLIWIFLNKFQIDVIFFFIKYKKKKKKINLLEQNYSISNRYFINLFWVSF